MSTSPGAANGGVGQILATLGHEIRNPLSALSHALEVWPSAQRDQVRMDELRRLMQRQVRQLVRLSEDLLNGTHSVDGELLLCPEPVPLGKLIDDACEEVRPFVDRCGHELTVGLRAESVAVYGNPSRLLQVFANLIQNAAKFTGRDGIVRVTVEVLDGMAVVRVCDNGPGIEKDRLSGLFEGVEHVAGGTGLESKGHGIGLRVVKRIVESHGGSIAVRSLGLGRGSEFAVRLPMWREGGRAYQP